MFKVNNEDMRLLIPFLNENNSHYPLLKSIIANRKKGIAYVDSLVNPSITGILSNDGWFYLLGESIDDNFNTKLKEVLLEKVIVDKVSIFWFGISEEWKKKFVDISSVTIRDYDRIQYKFIDSNYTLKSTNNHNYYDYRVERITLDNIDEVFKYNNELHTFWENKELFIGSGFGYIILDDNQIIGHSISASIEDKEVEIDIQTDESYRGKGIGEHLASCFINECLKRSMVPKWDCSAENVPSNKLAVRLGFQKIKKYPLSIISEK
jgi:RimJ/RimL family protein N-acetyltransferase